MAKIKSPWDDNEDNENPWENNIKNNPKIRPFKPQKPIEIEFKWWWILVVVALIWLASGFYQVQPNEEAIDPTNEDEESGLDVYEELIGKTIGF